MAKADKADDPADTINDAEAFSDPLDGLVERCINDPGAVFAPEVIAALAARKKENRAAFEAIRARLRKAGCRVTALDAVLAEDSDDERRETHADVLISLAGSAEL